MINAKYIPMFDEQEFVLVCRKNDYENGIIGDGLFLVSREEWEDTDDYSIKTFDLLLTAVENNVVKLYPAPNNAVVIFQTLPYSKKVDYIEVAYYLNYTIFTSNLIQHTDSVCDILRSIVDISKSRRVWAKTFLMKVAV